MRIVVTSSGPDLRSPVDPRFGRCAYFIFVDTETMKFKTVENPHAGASGGAGIQSAQLVANEGANVVLTGSCGPNAFQTLQTAGIEVIIGVGGIVQNAIQQYRAGALKPTAQPNVPPHFGMGYGPGQPMEPGWGRGRGMGARRARGVMGYAPEQELEVLKQQAEFLHQQMEEINRRIKELEKKKIKAKNI